MSHYFHLLVSLILLFTLSTLTVAKSSTQLSFDPPKIPSSGTAGYAINFRSSKSPGYATIARSKTQEDSFSRGLRELTVSMWIKTSFVTSGQQTTTLLDNSISKKQFRLSLIHSESKNTTDVQFRLGSRTGTVWDVIWSPNVSVDSLTWTHLAISWRNGTLSMYKDGVLAAEHATPKPLELYPGTTDLLVAASPTEEYVATGEVTQPYIGAIDDIQIWHVGQSRFNLEGTRAYHRYPNNHAIGIAGYWHLDEGKGLRSVNNIDGWYSHLVLHPHSVLVSSAAAAMEAATATAAASSSLQWIVSQAIVGDQIEQLEDMDTLIVLNATDNKVGRDLEYIITVLPTKGTLWEYNISSITNNGSSSIRGTQIKQVPHLLLPTSISKSKVVYAPAINSHSSVLDKYGKAANTYTQFSFRVKTASTESLSTSLYSSIQSVIRIFVDPVDDLPQFVHPPTVALQFADYGIEDPDAWEREGGEFMGVTLSITDTKDKDVLVPHYSKQISAEAAAAAAAVDVLPSSFSSDSRISLGSTDALDFAGPLGYGDGKNDVGSSKFSGSLSNVNHAINDFTLITPTLFGGTVSLEVEDQGAQGRGGSLATAHQVGVQLRSGSIPVISEMYPVSAPPLGGNTVLLKGTNFHLGGSHVCVFGTTRANATLLPSSQLKCPIPPSVGGRIGLISLLVINEAGFSSNTLQFLYEMSPTLIRIKPDAGPIVGGTVVLLLGEGFIHTKHLTCKIGEQHVPAQFVSNRIIKCVTPSSLIGSTAINVAVANNGVHFGSTAQFTYSEPMSVIEVSPQRGPSDGHTLVNVQGIHFQNSSLLTCRFGTNVVLAIYKSPTSIHCVVPSAKSHGSKPLPYAVLVGVANNGYDFMDSSIVTYTYVSPISISHISPKTGPVEGGTAIFIYGHNFLSSSKLQCRFGSNTVDGGQMVPSTFFSTRMVRCIAPIHARGRVVVEITTNNVDFTNNDVEFEYQVQAAVTSISPSFGPITGGTRVVLTGTGFPRTNKLQCRFGERGILVPAIWVAPTVVECIVPMVTTVQSVLVQLTSNTVDFTTPSDDILFSYIPPVRVLDISPSQGPSRGGTVVTVRGSGFVSNDPTISQLYKCSFGLNIVRAIMINSTHIRCTVPSISSSDLSVTVKVSTNGVQFTDENMLFVYYNSIQLTNIAPKAGPESGGTAITVHGSGFLDSTHLHCLFNSNVRVHATFINSQKISCISPPATTTTKRFGVTITVSNNGADISAAGALQYLYHGRPTVSSISPAYGLCNQVNSTTVLTVHGSGFTNTEELSCRVGNVQAVKTQFLSSTVLFCTIQFLQAGSHQVLVSNNKVDYSTSIIASNDADDKDETQFLSIPSFSIVSMYPTNGSLTGGTDIFFRLNASIAIEVIQSSSILSHCQFGVQTVTAVWENSSFMKCTTPAVSSPNSFLVDISVNGQDLIATNTKNINTLMFTYTAIPKLHRLTPKVGPAIGGTSIYLTGSTFDPKTDYFCKFGSGILSTVVEAHFSSPSLIRCVTPPTNVAGPVELFLSVNNIDFMSTGMTFFYGQSLDLGFLTPVRGPVRGGTEIMVTGTQFPAGEDLFCNFIDERDNSTTTVAKATWVSRSTLLCLTPVVTEPHTVSVHVMNLNTEFTDSSLRFNYHLGSEVSSIFPSQGSTLGGSAVIITGENFLNEGNCWCKFGNTSTSIVPAVFISSSSIECVTPAQIKSGSVCVEVSNNNVDFSHNCIPFQFTKAARIIEMYPKHGPKSGNTHITIKGKHFRAGHMQCRFGAIKTKAIESASNDTIVCVSPSSSLQNYVTLEVSNNDGIDFSQNGLQFMFVETPVINYVYPQRGPETGSTTLMIGGLNFYNSVDMTCLFFDDDGIEKGNVVKSPATWVSSSSLTCVSPPYRPSTVRVAISSNGQQHTDSNIPYEYHSRIGITQLLPTRGSLHGGTVVMLSGSGFINSTRLSCRFGSTIVLATFVSNASIHFTTPPYERGHVNVEVSNNGIDFSNNNIHYEFIRVSKIIQMIPRSGPASGGTQITFDVTNLAASKSKSIVSCRFNNEIIIEAQFVEMSSTFSTTSITSSETNMSQITCMSPVGSVGLVALEILFDGLNIAEQSLSNFLYYKIPIVNEILPKFVHESGGTSISVHGSNFKNTDKIFCRFGEGDSKRKHIVRATWLAAGLLECVAPAKQPGPAFVDVSFNGVDYTNDQVSIIYVTKTTITSMKPIQGNAGGGTIIEIIGTGFVSSSSNLSPVCIFGGIQIVSHIYNETHMKCKAPASPTSMSSSFPLSTQRLVSFNIMNSDFLQSTTGSESNSIDVQNKQSSLATTQLITSDWNFTYIPETLILSVNPSFGPINKSILITINAVGIPLKGNENGNAILCVFQTVGMNEYKVPIHMYSLTATSVQCMTPVFNGIGIISVRLIIENSDKINEKDEKDENNSSRSLNEISDISESSVQFTVHGNLQIIDTVPLIGSENGNTNILIHVDRGYGPISFTPLICIFGKSNTYITHATYVGNSQVECVSPEHAPGTVELTVATIFTSTDTVDTMDATNNIKVVLINNEATLIGTQSNAIQFTYYETITIVSILPTKINGRGGSRINILGTNFLNTSLLACRFGMSASQVVPATWYNSSSLSCITPHMDLTSFTNGQDISSININIYITTNGVEWFKSHSNNPTNDQIIVTHQSDAFELISLIPSRGPSIGGTVIQITMSNYKKEQHGDNNHNIDGNGDGSSKDGEDGEDGEENKYLACRFNQNIIVPAIKLSETSLQCITPTAPLASVTIDSMYRMAVEVTFNGIDYTNDGLIFTYYQNPEILSIAPKIGSEMGGQKIMINGVGFPKSSNLFNVLCKFGEDDTTAVLEKRTKKTAAVWISSRMLSCVTPVHSPGHISISLSFNNGVDYTDGSSIFEYQTAARISYIYPTSGSVYGGTTIYMIGVNFEQNNTITSTANGGIGVEAAASAAGTAGAAGTAITTSGSSNKLFCQFGTSITSVYILNETHMSCRTSPQLKIGSLLLNVLTQDGDLLWTEKDLMFKYLPHLVVSHINPTWGTVNGDTNIILRGNGMQNTSFTFCLFRQLGSSNDNDGNQEIEFKTQAMFLTKWRMSCKTPRVHMPGRYAVEVSNNGIEYSTNGKQYNIVCFFPNFFSP